MFLPKECTTKASICTVLLSTEDAFSVVSFSSTFETTVSLMETIDYLVGYGTHRPEISGIPDDEIRLRKKEVALYDCNTDLSEYIISHHLRQVSIYMLLGRHFLYPHFVAQICNQNTQARETRRFSLQGQPRPQCCPQGEHTHTG